MDLIFDVITNSMVYYSLKQKITVSIQTVFSGIFFFFFQEFFPVLEPNSSDVLIILR